MEHEIETPDSRSGSKAVNPAVATIAVQFSARTAAPTKDLALGGLILQQVHDLPDAQAVPRTMPPPEDLPSSGPVLGRRVP